MLSEEEQIALAMQMSLDPSEEDGAGEETPMDTEEGEAATAGEQKEDEDYSEVINDPAFLQSVLEGLPGVDPSSDAIRTAMSQLTKPPGAEKDSKDKGDKSKDDKQ
jgi:26S proteasome regulatory subunit N10